MNLNNDSRVIKCSLSFSAHCYFPLRAARLRYFHCPHTNPTPTCFALLEKARIHSVALTQQDNFGWGVTVLSGKESSKPSSFSASKKGQRKQGKAMQTQPHPERFVLQLQRNCSPEVLCQGFSDFFLSHILRSAL